MTWQEYVFREEILALLIPIVAIVVGGVIAIVHRVISHSERMAMIERGIHPDYPPETDEIVEEDNEEEP